MKKTGLSYYDYDFSVDYDAIAADGILDIHEYLMKKKNDIKIFGFVKKLFVVAMSFFGGTTLSETPLKCVSMNNQECKVRSEITNINSNEFFPFSIKTSKCSGSSNDINGPYTKISVPNIIKNINVRVFNLMPRTNETRHIKWNETCKCKCRLDVSVCNNKQRWNEDKCRCECKELIAKGVCDKGYIWNPSNCECECDKSCHFGEYLDHENCKCRKMLFDKPVEECTRNGEEVNLAGIFGWLVKYFDFFLSIV